MKRETRKAIYEYHQFHGDGHVKIVKEIFDENGLPAALVRLNDTESCIDFTYDYITEFDSFPRACEEEAVARFEGGNYGDCCPDCQEE
jgi:hypothetical protein